MKTLFYPITYNNRELILRNNFLLDEFSNNVYIVIPELENFFLRIINAHGVNNVTISSDYQSELNNCDRVFIFPGLSETTLAEAITVAREKKKEIHLAGSLIDSLKGTIDLDGVAFFGYDNEDCLAKPPVLYDVNIPVIGIMGLGDHCEKFTCELLAREYFTSMGYNVLQYGSKEISQLYGFNKIPNYVFDSNLTASARSLQFNHDVASAVENEHPNLIIVGAPGGIMPLSKTYLNNFGEEPLIIANALAVDYSIVGVYYQENYSKDFVKQINGILQYKFGTEFSSMCVSNTAEEINFEAGGRDLKYYHLDAYDITKLNATVDGDIPHFSINNVDETNEAFERIYKAFVQNVAAL